MIDRVDASRTAMIFLVTKWGQVLSFSPYVTVNNDSSHQTIFCWRLATFLAADRTIFTSAGDQFSS